MIARPRQAFTVMVGNGRATLATPRWTKARQPWLRVAGLDKDVAAGMTGWRRRRVDFNGRWYFMLNTKRCLLPNLE
jgi:hypothetical protein